MEKCCGQCKFYAPLKGDPPAGYCEFVEAPALPFWMDKSIEVLRRLPGSDITPDRGTECDAFVANK